MRQTFPRISLANAPSGPGMVPLGLDPISRARRAEGGTELAGVLAAGATFWLPQAAVGLELAVSDAFRPRR